MRYFDFFSRETSPKSRPNKAHIQQELQKALILAGCERQFRQRQWEVVRLAGAAGCLGCQLLNVTANQFTRIRQDPNMTPQGIRNHHVGLMKRLDNVERGKCSGLIREENVVVEPPDPSILEIISDTNNSPHLPAKALQDVQTGPATLTPPARCGQDVPRV